MDSKQEDCKEEGRNHCKICVLDFPYPDMRRIEDCGCSFCLSCMRQYITLRVTDGAKNIPCPDPACHAVITPREVEEMTDTHVMDKYLTVRLNIEVARDETRMWCPRPGCETLCPIVGGTQSQGVPVSCPIVGGTQSQGAPVSCP